MQQQELAQMRQRDANLTALAAIGPRKKRKVDSPGSGSGTEVQYIFHLWFCFLSLLANLSVQRFSPSLWKVPEQQKCFVFRFAHSKDQILAVVVPQGIESKWSFPDSWNWRDIRKIISDLTSLSFLDPHSFGRRFLWL